MACVWVSLTFQDIEPPQDAITFMTRLFHDARQNITISDLSVVSLSGSRPFLGSELNTGFLFAKHCGQVGPRRIIFLTLVFC